MLRYLVVHGCLGGMMEPLYAFLSRPFNVSPLRRRYTVKTRLQKRCDTVEPITSVYSRNLVRSKEHLPLADSAQGVARRLQKWRRNERWKALQKWRGDAENGVDPKWKVGVDDG